MAPAFAAVAPRSSVATVLVLAALGGPTWPFGCPFGPALAAAAAGDKGSSRGRMLSEEPRVELRAGFVPAADVEALRGLAEALGFEALDEASGANGGDEAVYLNESVAEGKADIAHAGWAASRRFAAAAAEWARAPVGGATPVVTRWESWSPGSRLNRTGMLHLDSRLRPRLRATVLAYLGGNSRARQDKDGGGVDGGFTVFPCLETDDLDAKELARRQKLCSRAARHLRHAQEKLLTLHAEGMQLDPSEQYAFLEEHPELTAMPKLTPDGLRPVDWQWTAAHDEVGGSSPGALRADPLFALAEAMCRGKAPGLRVAPAPGSALLLEAASYAAGGKELVPDWQLWHTGCSPKRGRGRRWTMQLFLEAGPAGEQPRQGEQQQRQRRPQAATCDGSDAACPASNSL